MDTIKKFKEITAATEDIVARFRAGNLKGLSADCTTVVGEMAELLQIPDADAREMFTTHLRETYQINAY